MLPIRPLVILLALFSIPFVLLAQSGDKTRTGENTATVNGRILFVDSLPLELASVSIVELKKETLTNSDGFYQLEGIPPGKYTLRIQLLDTKEINLPITLSAGETSLVDYQLKKENIVGL